MSDSKADFAETVLLERCWQSDFGKPPRGPIVVAAILLE